MVLRLDRAAIARDKITRLDSGAIRVPARLTRVGVFSYRQPDGSTRREYRPPAEVFAPSHLDALRSAPLTLDHPPETRVDASTWRRIAIGHVGDDVAESADRRFVEGSVVVSDARAISAVDAREREQVSIGYDVDLDLTPGVSPEGEAYDAVQRRIRPNHVALVPRGRAGADVGLRLDNADNEIPEGAPMKIKIGGKEYDVGSPEALAALAALEQRATRADSAEADARSLRSRVLRDRVRSARIEIRADADDPAIMAEVVKRIAPDVDLSSASPDYVAGAFAVAIAIALKALSEKSGEKPAEKPPAAPPPAEGAAGARADAIDARARRADAETDAETAEDVRQRVIDRYATQAFEGLPSRSR